MTGRSMASRSSSPRSTSVTAAPSRAVSRQPARRTCVGNNGDHPLSDLEEQGFLAARRPPMVDRFPVEDAHFDDLDTELVDAFLDAARERDPGGLGRFANDTELLRRAGVTLLSGQPTVAGLLALGAYPQQWFPR